MPSQTLRRLAGTAAVALAFSATANAAGLIDNDRAVNLYRPTFSILLAKAAGDDAARFMARGFMSDMEAKLKAPAEGKTSIVDFPPRANAELLRITAVVPPKGSEHLPIPVCAEQNNKVLGTWNITAKGDVLPVTGSWATSTTTNTACKDFITASRAEITRLAQSNQPAPTPYSAQPSAGPTTMQSAKPAEMVAGVSCILNEDPNQVSEARRLAQSSGSARLRDKMTRVLTECPNGKGLGEPTH